VRLVIPILLHWRAPARSASRGPRRLGASDRGVSANLIGLW
jgi:hypothetical protein